MQELFRKFSTKVSLIAGSVYAFALAIVVILAWSVTGPVFGFSDTWQLIINTGTTIVTFLMVFLIQNTQNRDNTALHAKLDELIVHTIGARNKLTTAEDYSEEELKVLKKHFERVAKDGGSGDGEPSTTKRATASHNGRSANGRKRRPASAKKTSSR